MKKSNLIKLIKKVIKYFFLSLIILILLGLGIYFIKPQLIEDTAVELLYPTVTIEDNYKNTYTIEIPKMNELMYIACSLTNTFQKDSNLINKEAPEYLKDVTAHFSKLKNHKLIQVLENKLNGNAYSQIQPTIRFFSLNYQIDENNTIVEKEIFHVNQLLLELFKDEIFYYPDYLNLIEDFAKKSDFNIFYNNHMTYYNTLIENFDQLCDIQGSWDFLEKRFTESYSSYRIIFSPLTGGFHNTLPRLKDKNTELQQTWLFVSAPPNNVIDSMTKDELEIKKSQFTRELFTEMDHNYVNPLTDRFDKKLEKAILNYKFWNKRERGYSSRTSTFNEYMTWGIFSLYAKQKYTQKNLDTIINIQEKIMVQRKKFIYFEEFNNKLIKLSEKQNIDSLHFQNIYPDIIDWMKNHH